MSSPCQPKYRFGLVIHGNGPLKQKKTMCDLINPNYHQKPIYKVFPCF